MKRLIESSGVTNDGVAEVEGRFFWDGSHVVVRDAVGCEADRTLSTPVPFKFSVT